MSDILFRNHKRIDMGLNYYRPKNFGIHELVHPAYLNKWGEENCWRRLNPRLLHDIDIIRELWGDTVWVNLDPQYGRGLRWPNENSFSSHLHGNAFDLVPDNGKYEEFWNFVKGLIEDGTLKYINVMEDFDDTPTWCHVAIMNIEEKLLIIKP